MHELMAATMEKVVEDIQQIQRNARSKNAEPAHVGRVGQDGPGPVLELVPLLEEIIAAMVADFLDLRAMADANLVEVGRVDDQFPAVGQDRFEFVHAFAGGPKLVVHRRSAGEDGMEGPVLIDDMDLAGEFAGLVPRALGRPGEQAGQFVGRRHHHAETELVHLHHGWRRGPRPGGPGSICGR